MKIIDVKQGSEEWMIARSAIPTASEFDALVTPKTLKIKTGDGPQTYLEKKLAEWWQGGPLPAFSGFGDMEQGTILEQEAIPWYSSFYDVDVNRVGFITSDDGSFGCSPDGLIGTDMGVEIKCPAAHTHVGFLLAGGLPEEYLLQVQGSMHVTGFKQWQFVSYRRHFPKLVLTIPRDERVQEVLGSALFQFKEKFEEGKRKLIEINGGPPKSRMPLSTYTPKPRMEQMEQQQFVSETPT